MIAANFDGTSSHLNLQIDQYAALALPEDFEFTSLLSDIIMGEYADVASDGKSLVRNGIILPAETVDNRAWRVVRVLLVGPKTQQVKVGDTVVIPGDKGLMGMSKSGKTLVFFNEERIFGVVTPIVKVEIPEERLEPMFDPTKAVPIKKTAKAKKK